MRHALLAPLCFLLTIVWACASHAAPPAMQTARDGARVLVLPFVAADSAPGLEWLGRGILQTTQADLSRTHAVQPITIDPTKKDNEPPAGGYDTATATRIAKSEGAEFVVFGTYQIQGGDVRVSGVVVDADTGRTVGGIKTTGSMRGVFDVEDDVSRQIHRALADAGVLPGPAPGQALPYDNDGPLRGAYGRQMDNLDSQASDSLNSQRMSSDYVDPGYGYYGGYYGRAYPYYYGDYAYPGYAPVYGYGDPYFGFGAVFINRPFLHHRGFDHRGFGFHHFSPVGGFHHVGGFHSTGSFRTTGGFHSAGGIHGGGSFHGGGGARGGTRR